MSRLSRIGVFTISVCFLVIFFLNAMVSTGIAMVAYLHVPSDKLTDESDVVLIGRVESQYSLWNEQHTLIYTYTTIFAEKILKGAVNSYEVIVISEGGALDGLRQESEFQVTFTLGEKVKLFLQRINNNQYKVTRMSLGKITLAKGYEAFTTEDESEYTLSGRRWPASSFPIQYYINVNGTADSDEEFDRVQQGVNLWGAVTNCPASYKGTTSSTFGQDGINLHSWVTDLPQYVGGRATRWWNSLNEIVEADIRYNDNMDWSNGIEIVGLTAHEWGHALGLDHSTVTTATMYPTINLIEAATLAADDIAAIRALYSVYPSIPTLTDFGIIVCVLAISCLIVFKPQFKFSWVDKRRDR